MWKAAWGSGEAEPLCEKEAAQQFTLQGFFYFLLEQEAAPNDS